MKLKNLLIMMTIFSALMLGMGNFLISTTSLYSTLNPELSQFSADFEQFNKTNTEIMGLVTDLENKTLTAGSKLGNLDVTAILDIGVILKDVVALILQVPNIFAANVNMIVKFVGIGGLEWVSGLVISAVIISAVFGLIAWWRRWHEP